MKRILYFTALIVASAGCSSIKFSESDPVVRKVIEILEDKTSAAYEAVEASAARNNTGSIFVVGEYAQTSILKNRLLEIDSRDNVTGAYAPDGIADFAGERFLTLFDSENTPYSAFFDEDRLEDFRTLAVDHCLAAIDTVFSISPYDKTGQGRKQPSKFIILNSAYFSSFGEYDASFLFSSCGSAVRIVTPLTCMLEELMKVDKNSYRIGVLASGEIKNHEVYQTAFRKVCSKNTKTPSVCFVHDAEWDEDPLFGLLDSYIESGNIAQLDAILVDDHSITPDALMSTFSRIGSIMDEASLKYGPYIADDCIVVFGAESVAARCYDTLREKGFFRLMIARPQSTDCMTSDGYMIPYSNSYITVID